MEQPSNEINRSTIAVRQKSIEIFKESWFVTCDIKICESIQLNKQTNIRKQCEREKNIAENLTTNGRIPVKSANM